MGNNTSYNEQKFTDFKKTTPEYRKNPEQFVLKMSNDSDFCQNFFENNFDFLSYATPDFLENRNIILTAVKYYGDNLQYACEELKNDKEIVLHALKHYDRYFEYVGEELKKDKEFILENFKKNHYALKIFSFER
jgi:hypothetical protein